MNHQKVMNFIHNAQPPRWMDRQMTSPYQYHADLTAVQYNRLKYGSSYWSFAKSNQQFHIKKQPFPKISSEFIHNFLSNTAKSETKTESTI